MSIVNITVVSGETVGLGLTVPGVQGPAGAGVASGGTVNQVLYKLSGTNYDTAWGNVTSAMIGDLSIVDADINASAAISLSKLATGALPSGITVSSGNIVDGTITNVDINASAAIALSKLATGALPSGVTVNSSNIVDDSITNADVNSAAAIAGTKISPNFGGQTIVSSGVFSHPLGTASAPSITFTGDLNNGIFSPAADNVSVATAGIERLRIDSTGQIEAVSSGTAATPVYTFINDTDTGLYTVSGNTLGITTSGTARVTVDDTIAPIKEVYSSVFYPVVTQTDIGTAPDQVPLSGMLGDMAFVNFPFMRGGSDTTTTSGTVDINALSFERFNYTASMATGVTVQFSNMMNGREVKLYLRNTNATARPITFLASTTSSGHTAVNLSNAAVPGSVSVSGVTLSGTTGTAMVWVGNINGTIVGSLC